MRKAKIAVGLILVVLLMGTSYGTFGKNIAPQIALISPKNAGSITIGTKVDVYVNLSHGEETGRHRVWFILQMHKSTWADAEWVTLPTSPPNNE